MQPVLKVSVHFSHISRWAHHSFESSMLPIYGS